MSPPIEKYDPEPTDRSDARLQELGYRAEFRVGRSDIHDESGCSIKSPFAQREMNVWAVVGMSFTAIGS